MAKNTDAGDNLVAYRYRADRNPDGGFLPGVGLRDVSVEELAAMPEWLRASVAAAPFYEAVSGAPERGASAPMEG